MSHLILLLICIISVEVFIRIGFLSILDSILRVTRKVTHIIPKENISDHWKEKVIPVYALRIMKLSLQVILIISCILFIIFAADLFVVDFLSLSLSFIGIIESMVFAFGYVHLRRLVKK
jgi:hypothetical protein